MESLIKKLNLLTSSFILAFSLLVPSNCWAQEEATKGFNRDTIITAAREIAGTLHYCALITLDSTGLPNVRTMNPYPLENDMIVWMATNRLSRKAK